MKKFLVLSSLSILCASCTSSPEKPMPQEAMETTREMVQINPISHATAHFEWGGHDFYLDPVGGAEAFAPFDEPEVILVTDTHGDHFNLETLEALATGNVSLIVPQAVYDELSSDLKIKAKVLNNGETIGWNDFEIEAVPMYNLPEDPEAFHTKGRGNGYIIQKDNYRFYIAGDTEGTPEMRALEDINYALIPMNLPYTMDVDQAAEAVLEFTPEVVSPYHYRGTEGLSDIERFKELVQTENPDIEVEFLDWYPSAN